MSTTSSTEIQQLKEFIGDRFNQLDQKVDEVRKDLKDLSNKVESIDKRLVIVETKVDSIENRFGTVESKLPDISEKFGELKNWRQIAFIIIAAVLGWLARSGRL